MRVFVAGATGVIGRRLLPLLSLKGHEVVGLARSASTAIAVQDLGADVARADALDSGMLARVGANRVVTQGLACVYDPHRWVPATEASPWWRNPPSQFAPVLGALRELEERTKRAGGLVLRLGQLYGPGTMFAPDGSLVRQVQAGKLPIVGSGFGTFSFLHVDDAAAAVAAALDSSATGALNIVDDEPAPVREWLPFLAELLDAPAPRQVPVALARLAAGGWGVAWMTQLRGAYNMPARYTLDWRPQHVTWRQGFATELARATQR
ncbi:MULTISPECIES: NAD-dependent epimerase/dehydratase family protein [unclassified Kribbella]|uniref:NAD-dependent epimerase/dehydratase family protein n=1 Tax=unclassified Kribbella TaxID=2644121 RepID=UPI0033FD06E5